MKNFDYDLYNSLHNGESTEEWLAMCDRCYAEFLMCKPCMSDSFIKWYENGNLHDSIIENISSSFDREGHLTVKITLQDSDLSDLILCYSDVKAFRIQKSAEPDEFNFKESYMYGEFYRVQNSFGDIVHEFFTLNDNFFYIEFNKLHLHSKSKINMFGKK